MCLFWLAQEPSAPTPKESGNMMLDWAGDTATSQGAEVTGPKAVHESAAGNSHFLLLGPRFLAGLLATRVPSGPRAPPPPRQGPLALRHISASQCQPRACSCCRLLSESSLGLSAWVRLSPILAASEASRLLGHVPQCPWLSPHLLGSPVRSGLHLSLHLTLLSLQ